MKFFTNKKLIQKLIIIFVCIFLLNFCIAPTRVQAAGGKLFAPVKLFATAIADIFISTVQWAITGQWISAVEDNSGELGENADKDFWKRKIDFPVIQISPELIFSNKIELLNIDFISGGNNNQKYIIEDDKHVTSDLRKIIASWYVTLRTIAIVGSLSVLIYIGIRIMISSSAGQKSKYKQMIMDWVVAFCILLFMHYIMSATINIVNKIDEKLADATDVTVGVDLQAKHGNVMYNPKEPEEFDYEDYGYEENDEEYLKQYDYINSYVINYFEKYVYYKENENLIPLQDGISNKILTREFNHELQSNGENIWKFKYYFSDGSRQDVLEFGFETTAGTQTRNARVSTTPSNSTAFEFNDFVKTEYAEIVDGPISDQTITENNTGDIIGDTITTVEPSKHDGLSLVNFGNNKTALISNYSTQNGGGSKILYFINYARLYVNADNTYTAFGYLILYIILVVFVVMFTLRYMKRVIYVAFLTLIAPLVALTYPIDKLRDGKAQAFNMWFREYIFNVLIQPFHLLIYTILVGSALTFASQYMIYAIIVIWFLIPAENLLRSFFGFDKAGTLSAAGSFAGGALFSTMLNKINRGKSGGSGGSGGTNEEKSSGTRKPSDIKMTPAKELFFGTNSISSDNAQGQDTNVDTSTQPAIVPVPTPISPELPDTDGDTYTGGSQESSSRGGSTGANTNGGTYTGGGQESSSSGGYSGAKLTDPVFKRGDKLRMAMGYKKDSSTGEWKKTGTGLSDRLGGAVGAAAYLQSRTLLNKAKTLPRMARRIAIGGTVGGGLAVAGLAVGAASGNASNAFKLAASGAAAGYYGSNYYGDKLAKSVGNSFQSSKVNFWGSDIKQIEQSQFDKQFLSDPKNIDTLTRALGTRQEARDAIKKGHVQAFLNQGITDPVKIGKSLALMNKNKLGAKNDQDGLKKAVALASWERNISHSIYDVTSTHRAEFIKREVEELVEAGMDKETATQRVNKILENLEYLNT